MIEDAVPEIRDARYGQPDARYIVPAN